MSNKAHTQVTKPEPSPQVGSHSNVLQRQRTAFLEPDDAKETAPSSYEEFRHSVAPFASKSTNLGHNFSRVSVFPPARPPIQPKHKISQPNDIYEQEADRVADQVMRMPAPVIQRNSLCPPDSSDCRKEGEKIQAEPIDYLQRAEAEEKEEEEQVQASPLDRSFVQCQSEEDKKEENEVVQTKNLEDPSEEAVPSAESRIQSLRGGGEPLTDTSRSFFEPRFGHDFSKVRIHADAEADRVASSINARAFTRGQDIYFKAGYYRPSSESGRTLIAHELTHFVQQNAGCNNQRNLPRIISPAGEQLRNKSSLTVSSASYSAVTQRQAGGKEESTLEKAEALLIETSLKAAVLALEKTSDKELYIQLGPTAPFFKAGLIGFINRMAKEGGRKIIALVKNYMKAIESPNFALGWLLGFLKGFFLDGLFGIFILFYDLATLSYKAVNFAIDAIKAMGRAGLEEILSIAEEVREISDWISQNSRSLWDAFAQEIAGRGGISKAVSDVLEALLEKAKELAKSAGEAIAEQLIKFFSQASAKLGEALGEMIGRISGMAVFEVVVAVLTAGGSSVLTAAKTGVKTTLSFLARMSRGTVEALKVAGDWLKFGFSAVAGWIRALGKTKFFKTMGAKLEALFQKVVQFIEKALLKLKGKTSEGKGPGTKAIEAKAPKGEAPKVQVAEIADAGKDITDSVRAGTKIKPTSPDWTHSPNWKKWTESGGKIKEHPDGSVTLTAKDGTSVKYTPEGNPDFKPHLNDPWGIKEVKIDGFTKRPTDFKKANEAAGHPEWGDRSPPGYTWHHTRDGRTLQLVSTRIHRMFRHSGGIADLKK